MKNLKEYIKKEQNYRNIIEKLTKKLRPGELYAGADHLIKMEQIREMHKGIIDTISLAQMRTSKILLEQEKSIIHFYNEKINDLTKQFQAENLRQQKRHKDFRQKEENLLSELEWIKGIAHKIDIENFYLVKRHMELKVEYETQKNDRTMLIQESVLQKKKKETLEKRIKYYKNMVNRLMSDEDILKDLGENPNEFNFDEFKALQKIRKQAEIDRDARTLLYLCLLM